MGSIPGHSPPHRQQRPCMWKPLKGRTPKALSGRVLAASSRGPPWAPEGSRTHKTGRTSLSLPGSCLRHREVFAKSQKRFSPPGHNQKTLGCPPAAGLLWGSHSCQPPPRKGGPTCTSLSLHHLLFRFPSCAFFRPGERQAAVEHHLLQPQGLLATGFPDSSRHCSQGSRLSLIRTRNLLPSVTAPSNSFMLTGRLVLQNRSFGSFPCTSSFSKNPPQTLIWRLFRFACCN